jgi:hypothetical protein
MLGLQLDNLKTVNTIDWIGYTREHGAYVFNDLAIAGGKVHKLNEEDFFDVGKLSVKSQSQSPVLHINPDLAPTTKAGSNCSGNASACAALWSWPGGWEPCTRSKSAIYISPTCSWN